MCEYCREYYPGENCEYCGEFIDEIPMEEMI